MHRKICKYSLFVLSLIFMLLLASCGSSSAIGKGNPRHNTKTTMNPVKVKKDPAVNRKMKRNATEPKIRSKVKPAKSKSKPVPSDIKYKKNPHTVLGHKQDSTKKIKGYKRDKRGYHKTLGQRK